MLMRKQLSTCWPGGIETYNLMHYVDVFNNTFIKYDMDGSEHPRLDLLINYAEDFLEKEKKNDG